MLDKLIHTVLVILFFVLFVFIITPLGIILRLFRIDYLKRGIDKDASSYWLERDA